ncbi:hypothetical protein vseg_007246 [Gypsophila vaccaria]
MENSEKSYNKLSKNRNQCHHSVLKTDLSLGLPGSDHSESKQIHLGLTIFGKDLDVNSQTLRSSSSKRGFPDAIILGCDSWNLSFTQGPVGNFDKVQDLGVKNVKSLGAQENKQEVSAKSQVVGWPPIRSYRKNTMASAPAKNSGKPDEKSASECLYVKVSMDGAPYLRKVDLQVYKNYTELSSALEKMFTCSINSQYASHGQAKGDVLTYEDKDGDWMLVGDVPWKMFTENCRKLRIMKGSEAIGLAPNAADKGKIQA